MVTRRAVGVVAAVVLGAAALTPSAERADADPPGGPNRLALEPCTLAGRQAECGTLPVYEDRATMRGRVIDLNVVRVPARPPVHGADAVVYLSGGPGGAATSDAAWALRNLLHEVNEHRDAVFVDQRGTGDSNGMSCSAPLNEPADLDECLVTTRGDPRAYTTAWAMDDLDEVRAALGYDTLNLVGFSYGATAAQVYLQRHPDRVRTATLAGATLLDVPFTERVPWASGRAFDVLVDRCGAASGCQRAYPDTHSDLDALLAVLDRGPVTLPRNLHGEPLVATRDAFGLWLHYQLMGTYRASDLPKILHRAATEDDWEPLATSWLDLANERLAAGPSLLMNWTIGCHEPWARQRSLATMAWATGSFLSYADVQTLGWPEDLCALVPEPDPAAIYDPPAEVAAPVLIVNTDGDPQNPPENVADANRHYPASRVLVAPALSHQEWSPEFVACLATMTAAFVAAGSVEAVDAGCLDTVTAPPITLPAT